ncbi:MAG: SPOR domain-containing protein [Wenzhouxiangellaceae bacterium]
MGFEAFRFSEVVGERQIWRVRVGPVADRAAAEALLRRVADQAGVDGLVVSHP